MKKTLLAVVIAAMSASMVQAHTIYQQDGATVDLYGRFGATFDKSEKTKVDLRDDGSRVGFKVNYDLGNKLHALGGVEFRFSDADGRFSDPTTHDAYAGLKHLDVGTLTLGRQATTADDLALSKYAYRREDITLLPKNGDRTVKFRSANFGSEQMGYISFGADYTFLGTNHKDEKVKSKSVGGGLFYTHRLGDLGFKLNAGYAHSDLKASMVDPLSAYDKHTTKAWQIGSELSYDKLSLAFDYAHSDEQGKKESAESSPKLKKNVFQLAAKYEITPEVGVFTTYQYGKEKMKAQDIDGKYQQYTLGADYKLHKNVVTYAQLDVIKVRDKASNEKASEVGGAVGLRVYF